MADVWQTIEQAAVTLGLSVRTVNRYITAGKLQSRLFEGRREVLVETSSSDPTSTSQGGEFSRSKSDGELHSNRQSSSPAPVWEEGDDSPAKPNERRGTYGEPTEPEPPRFGSTRQAVHARVNSERSVDSHMMLALADSIDDKTTLAVAAYQNLARSSEQQVHSLRRVAFGAWATVVMMAVGIMIAIGYGTYRLTKAEVTANNLSEGQSKLNSQLDQLTRERDQLRQQAERLALDANDFRNQANNRGELAQQLADLRAIEQRIRELENSKAVQSATGPATQPGGSNPIPSGTGPNGSMQNDSRFRPTTLPYPVSPVNTGNVPGPATRPAGNLPPRQPLPANPQGIFGVP